MPTSRPAAAPLAAGLSRPLASLKPRLSPRLVAALKKKNLVSVQDLLFLLPRTYDDRRTLKRIAQLVVGQRGTVVATVSRVEDVRAGRRRMFKAVLSDATGSLAATHFQTGAWLRGRYPVGKKLVISGEVRASTHGWEMPHPEVESADDLEAPPTPGQSAIHFHRIVPVYPGFERHEQRALRELAFLAVAQAPQVVDALPEALRARRGLPGLAQALAFLHFPPADADLDALEAHATLAHRRLAYDELFSVQLGLSLQRRGVKLQPGIAFDVAVEKKRRAVAVLPFKLTQAQTRVLGEISRDMARPEPMHRLVQGDVGSGKTAVAVVASVLALENGYQVAVMAPTQLVAEQHFRTFSAWLQPAGYPVALVSGGSTARERAERRRQVEAGEARVVVGTHALLEEDVAFQKLGLVIIDEQHRFGVAQRQGLMAKGQRPDVLVMTATPIPRTLAMTLYGDLDVSVIDELPPGRTPVHTRVFGEKQRGAALKLLEDELAQGRQAYVVYPLVEESEKVDLLDATQGAQALAAALPRARLGLLHGRLKPAEKDAVMSAFRAHRLDVLVATTVVEVGVDVPNASVMLIEHAERFGLSQLHQLRGRVGRGAARSFCFLVAGYARGEDARARLAVMEATTDGFRIAQEDLELRGPGELLGLKQSGVPELSVANLARDQDLVSFAQEDARALLELDPRLERPEHHALAHSLEGRWKGKLQLARVG